MEFAILDCRLQMWSGRPGQSEISNRSSQIKEEEDGRRLALLFITLTVHSPSTCAETRYPSGALRSGDLRHTVHHLTAATFRS